MSEYKLYRYRWVMVALFWFLMFAYGSNWFALSPMLTTFEKEFSIETWQSHLLLSIIGLFVIFFAWPAGNLIDKKGTKLSASIGAFFMLLGFGLRPWLLGSFSTLLLSSVIAGIGLAWILVALAPQMLRWFPREQASLPVGIASSGLFIGFGTGALSMPFLVGFFSESIAFLVFSIIALLAFILWIGLAKDCPPTPPEQRQEVKKVRFSEGIKDIFTSRNAFFYPAIGFIIVGATLASSAFIHFLYPGEKGGLIGGGLLYGCAAGAFLVPFAAKKHGIRKISLLVAILSLLFWLGIYFVYSYSFSWYLCILLAFLFGFTFQASWPLALYCQETEKGVTEANEGIASGLYISLSNIGAATLPVAFGYIQKNISLSFSALSLCIALLLLLWALVRRTS